MSDLYLFVIRVKNARGKAGWIEGNFQIIAHDLLECFSFMNKEIDINNISSMKVLDSRRIVKNKQALFYKNDIVVIQRMKEPGIYRYLLGDEGVVWEREDKREDRVVKMKTTQGKLTDEQALEAVRKVKNDRKA